jgi:hypothetical protein
LYADQVPVRCDSSGTGSVIGIFVNEWHQSSVLSAEQAWRAGENQRAGSKTRQHRRYERLQTTHCRCPAAQFDPLVTRDYAA